MPYPGYVEMAKSLTRWRNAEDTARLAQVPVHPQRQALRRFAAA